MPRKNYEHVNDFQMWQQQMSNFGMYQQNQNRPYNQIFETGRGRDHPYSGNHMNANNMNNMGNMGGMISMSDMNKMPMMHQQAMFQSYDQNDPTNSMMTLSPRQMCKLQRECPEACMLIQQQQYMIWQQRMQLDSASKEMSKLHRMLKDRRRRSCDDNNNDEDHVPPAISIEKPRSPTPSSPLTASSTDSPRRDTRKAAPPLKKRIMEVSREVSKNDEQQQQQQQQLENKENNNESKEIPPKKKSRCGLPDLAKVAATLSAAASPLHKESRTTSTPISKKRSPRPDLATVAATLAAATSPVFQQISSSDSKRRNSSENAFRF